MNKFFATFLISIVFQIIQAQPHHTQSTPSKEGIAQLIQGLEKIPGCPLHIPFWRQVRALSLITVSAGLGNLLVYAAKNNQMLEKNSETANITCTALGLLLGIYFAYKTESKQGIIKNLDLRLIRTALDWNNDPNIMREKILALFPHKKHAHLTAVRVLEKNHQYLCALKEIFLKAQRNSKTYKTKDLQEQLESAIIALEATIIVMKQDPVWIKQSALRQDKIENAWIAGIFVAMVDLVLGK